MSQNQQAAKGASQTVINHSKRPIRLPTGHVLGTAADEQRTKRGIKALCDKPRAIKLSGEEIAVCKKVKAFEYLVENRELEVR